MLTSDSQIEEVLTISMLGPGAPGGPGSPEGPSLPGLPYKLKSYKVSIS